MSELDPMDLNCSSFMTIFNSCLALCSSFLQPCSQSWSTGSRYQHLMIVFMHPSKYFSIIKDVKPNSPSRHYMNTCRQEEEHGVLVGHLLDQPHVMRQEGLVALVPAPTPKYKRQVANFSTSSAFVFRRELRRRHLIVVLATASFLLRITLGPLVLNVLGI